MRIFLDANILFSAAKTDGAIRRLLGLLRERGHEAWADDYVVEEARRNLQVKAPDALAALAGLLSEITTARHQSVVGSLAAGDSLPEDDRRVLAAAIHNKCGVLVTSDRTHFGTLYGMNIGGVVIHSPRSLAESLL